MVCAIPGSISSTSTIQAPHTLVVQALGTAVSPEPHQNVVGVGVGEKIVDGEPAGEQAVKFLMQVKYPKQQIDSKYLLPQMIDGLPVDVEQVGLFRSLATSAKPELPNPRTRIRPACPGCSIGFKDPGEEYAMAGTFGALVRDDTDTYILSNNHVLADGGRLPIRTPIFSPGLLDDGNPNTDQIAELTRFVPLKADVLNKVDCAIARAERSLVSNAVLQIGPPQGSATATVGMIVHKFGRTSGYRAGRVVSIDTDVKVLYDTGTFIFEQQIIIVGLANRPFCDAGDSGSLILERRSQYAIGLLFAGSLTHTVANHITDVLEALNVCLL
jgi:S1-C subfamily serine protease